MFVTRAVSGVCGWRAAASAAHARVRACAFGHLSSTTPVQVEFRSAAADGSTESAPLVRFGVATKDGACSVPLSDAQAERLRKEAAKKQGRVVSLGSASVYVLDARDTQQQDSDWVRAGAALASAASATAASGAATVLHATLQGCGDDAPRAASLLAEGFCLRSYDFKTYKSSSSSSDASGDAQASADAGARALHVMLGDTDGVERAKAAFAKRVPVLAGVYSARDLMNEPPNVLYPESFAERCRKLGELGLQVSVLDVEQMRTLGMGALLGVAQGSVRPARLVVIEHRGASSASRPMAFVGKGVTFDSGGISIKPAQNMDEMKFDMGGAAAVVGLMESVARARTAANVVGLVGLVENMPDGGAQRPGDIVRSMAGKTIEVLNTDAEGRLVLADVLHYAQQQFKPRLMVDLATLTGAIVVSLGSVRAGLFANNDTLANGLLAAGEHVRERLWRLPLDDDYDRGIDSKVADVANIGAAGFGAGSITAAAFLQRFVEKGVPWAHLDIAGTAYSGKPGDFHAHGATAFGVRLLHEFVARTVASS